MMRQAVSVRLRGVISRKAPNASSVDFLLRAMAIVLASITLFSTMAVTDPGARFNDLGHRMMCTCTCNQVLLECNHVGCPISGGMRAELQTKIDRGDNDDLVLESFVQKYGAVVLAAPGTTGFSRVAWIMPFLVLTLGLGTTVLLVRRWRQRSAGAVVATPRQYPMLDGVRQEKIRRETEL